MRIKAECKVVTLGDLKAAVKAFESQGFREADVLNPPSEWLPPEAPATQEGFNRTLASFSKIVGQNAVRKDLGMVLFMKRTVPSTDLPGE